MYKFKRAFTLAEVLITLLIIGVIASIVIPGLINDTKDAEYNAGVKKIYADLSAAVKMIQVNNGGSIAVGLGTASTDYVAFRNEFCNVMACAKKDTGTNIFPSTAYKFYKSSGDWSLLNIGIDNTAILTNGTLLRFDSLLGCNNRGVNVCGMIYVDLNGQKGPNMMGKDAYMFYVSRQNGTGAYLILPAGTQGDINTPASTCVVGGGLSCAFVRLTNPDGML